MLRWGIFCVIDHCDSGLSTSNEHWEIGKWPIDGAIQS